MSKCKLYSCQSVNCICFIIFVKTFSKPASLNVITGSGMSYTRNDGINVISLASLGK